MTTLPGVKERIDTARQQQPAVPIPAAPEPAVSWKELKPLPPALPEAPVMPESLIPPVLAPWLCDICERTQIPLDFVAAPAIAALASVIGRTVGIYWAARAHDLDWTALDLFGAHPKKPLERFDCAGLILVLNGAVIVALSGIEAVIEKPNGARVTFRRRGQVPEETCLIWELK